MKRKNQETCVHGGRIQAGVPARSRPRARRGLTLVESLMGAVLLVTVVTAVLGALSAGHQHALEAKRLVTASLAAEQLMARIASSPYQSIGAWDGWSETPGDAHAADSEPMPSLFDLVGRRVSIDDAQHSIDELQVVIRGLTVTVESYDTSGRVLARLVRFIPEPQA